MTKSEIEYEIKLERGTIRLTDLLINETCTSAISPAAITRIKTAGAKIKKESRAKIKELQNLL